MTTDRRLRTYCCAPSCVEPAEGFVAFAYVHEQRYHLCAEHMRPIRAALLPLVRPAPTPAPASSPREVCPDCGHWHTEQTTRADCGGCASCSSWHDDHEVIVGITSDGRPVRAVVSGGDDETGFAT